MDNNIVEGLRKRYPNLHPLIFQRSLEHAKNETNLFDILEGIPKKYPITWDDDLKSWVRCKDLTFQDQFFKEFL
jgi:hypothetical protein